MESFVLFCIILYLIIGVLVGVCGDEGDNWLPMLAWPLWLGAVGIIKAVDWAMSPPDKKERKRRLNAHLERWADEHI